MNANAGTSKGLRSIITAVVSGWNDAGELLVTLPDEGKVVSAQSTVPLEENDVGSQVILQRTDDEIGYYVVIGKIIERGKSDLAQPDSVAREFLELSASKRTTIRCGRASITLTPSGKIILRGTYISTRSSGVVRIKGGSVQIN